MSDPSQQPTPDQPNAVPLLTLIVKIFGALAFLCILCGGTAAAMNVGAPTSVVWFGVKCTTASAGIAMVAMGLIVDFLVVKEVLKRVPLQRTPRAK